MRPEVLRVDLPRVVERPERLGPDALDVPGVEELVREEQEQCSRYAFSGRNAHGSIATDCEARCSRPPRAPGARWTRKRYRSYGRPPKSAAASCDERLQVLHEARRVLVAAPPDRERVRDALHAEVERAVRAALERRVHELVVVAARKTPPRAGSAIEVFQPLGRRKRDLQRLVLPALDVEEQVRAVAVAVRGVEVRRADGQLVGVDAVGNENGRPGGGFLGR